MTDGGAGSSKTEFTNRWVCVQFHGNTAKVRNSREIAFDSYRLRINASIKLDTNLFLIFFHR